MKQTIILILFTSIIFTANSQQLQFNWVASAGGPNWDMVNCMCENDKGSVFIAGSFQGSIEIGGSAFQSVGGKDIYIAEYSADGDLIEAYCLGGKDSEYPVQLNYSKNLVLMYKYQKTEEVANSKQDYTNSIFYKICSLEKKGKYHESIELSSTGALEISGMKQDSENTLFVTGWFTNELTIGSQTYLSKNGETTFIAAIDIKKKETKITLFAGEGESRIYTFNFGEGNSLLLAGVVNEDCFNKEKKVKFSNKLHKYLFTAKMDKKGAMVSSDFTLSCPDIKPVSVIEQNNELWVASAFKHFLIDKNDTIKTVGNLDILISRAGNEKQPGAYWTYGGKGKDAPLGLKQSGEHLILTALFSDTLIIGNKQVIAGERGCDALLVSFDDKGQPGKVLPYGKELNDFPCDLQCFESGIFLAGQYKKGISFGGEELSTKGSYDIFLARLDNCNTKAAVDIDIITQKGIKGEIEYALNVLGDYSHYEWESPKSNHPSLVVKKAGEYNVEVIDDIGCVLKGTAIIINGKSAKIEIDEGLGQVYTETIIYPTLTNGDIHLKIGSDIPDSQYYIRIFNHAGKNLINKHYSNPTINNLHTINLQGYSAGQYLVEITAESFRKVAKVILKSN